MPKSEFFARVFARPITRSISLYVAAFAIGLLAGHGIVVLLPTASAFVALMPLARITRDRWLVPLGYYGAFLVTMFPGAAVFFGHSFDPFGITLLWLFFSALFAAPWALLLNSTTLRLRWAVPFVLLIESIPPLGLFAVGNPLHATGVMLPHTGWYGLAAVLLLSSFAATHPRYALPSIAALTIFSTLVVSPAPVPKSWVAIDTRLGGQGLDRREMLRDYQTALYIQQTALDSKAKVIIFPEGLVEWNTATEAFWRPTLTTLAAQHRTLLLGATVLIPGPPGNYRNTAVLRGATNTIFDQRVPIPVTMWHPLGGGGVPINAFGKGTVLVGGQRAGIFICYEQLLVWTFIRALEERPTVLVGIANDYWAAKTYFPKIQNANMVAWGRLFNLPVLTAVNQ